MTNNFVETAIRLFKDIVLSRKKAYNLIERNLKFNVSSITCYFM